MSREQSGGIAAQIAILIASRRAGDKLGERVARRRLREDYGVRLAFAGAARTAQERRTVEVSK